MFRQVEQKCHLVLNSNVYLGGGRTTSLRNAPFSFAFKKLIFIVHTIRSRYDIKGKAASGND